MENRDSVTPAVELPKQERVLAGIGGALLFSLAGVALYVLIYQLGYVTGISGIVMVVLGIYGYQLLSGKKNSMKGIISACIITVVMLAVAEYLSLCVAAYSEWSEMGLTFAEAFKLTNEVLQEPDVLKEVLTDYGMALLFSVLVSVGYIMNIAKAAKAERKKAAELPENRKPPMEL